MSGVMDTKNPDRGPVDHKKALIGIAPPPRTVSKLNPEFARFRGEGATSGIIGEHLQRRPDFTLPFLCGRRRTALNSKRKCRIEIRLCTPLDSNDIRHN
jgi:hypothetical protein